ncbi:hypothetical protein [Leifsonia sp. Leaf264]|uniref:hypothetical protein n=1 Tax=Leifsonia sp. Leaf264 TaxID=1736314 RepID=UPI0007000774|nr:hypothetical protein [Leifsonia sp. Leaf264]KQO98526.1 hypothetical protein ASF30_10720 [Leifsonia sp. Leaf264]
MTDALYFTITGMDAGGRTVQMSARPSSEPRGIIHDVFESFAALHTETVAIHAVKAEDGFPAAAIFDGTHVGLRAFDQDHPGEWLLVATFAEPPFSDTPGTFTPAGGILWQVVTQLGRHDEQGILPDVFDGVRATANPAHLVVPPRLHIPVAVDDDGQPLEGAGASIG